MKEIKTELEFKKQLARCVNFMTNRDSLEVDMVVSNLVVTLSLRAKRGVLNVDI